jgi:hypothetical protein
LMLPGRRAVYKLSGTVAVNRSITIDCRSTIRPWSAPPSPTAFFTFTASGVHIDGHNGSCTFDGVSAEYQNFTTAVVVQGASAHLRDVRVTGLRIMNLGLNFTTAGYGGYVAIALQAVRLCEVSGNTIVNSGPTELYSMGFAIYLAYTADCNVSRNTIRRVGGAGINDSAGLRNTFSENLVSFASLFGYKGGYGYGFFVANSTRSKDFFSIADGPNARAAFTSGQYINVLDSHGDCEGTVSEAVPQPGGLLLVMMTEPMLAVPSAGDSVEPLSTALRYSGNVCENSGDNCHDINGWHDIRMVGEVCRAAGMFEPTGRPFGGLATCVWLGYDPQDTASSFRGIGARILGTTVDVVGGTGIMVTEGVSEVIVDGYTLRGVNAKNMAGDAGCGIAMNPFNINPHSRGADTFVGSGVVTGSTPNSCLAWIENSSNDTIVGLTGTAAFGIVTDAGGADRVRDCDVTATGARNATAAYLVGAGGGLHEHGVVFANCTGRLTAGGWGDGGHGYGFLSLSPLNSGIAVGGGSRVTGSGAGFIERAGFSAFSQSGVQAKTDDNTARLTPIPKRVRWFVDQEGDQQPGGDGGLTSAVDRAFFRKFSDIVDGASH